MLLYVHVLWYWHCYIDLLYFGESLMVILLFFGIDVFVCKVNDHVKKIQAFSWISHAFAV